MIPPGLLTPLERLLVLEIADECWDSTREGYPGADVLAALVDRPERSVEETLKSIAKKWLELRVALGTDRNGKPVYAHRGQRTTFRVPPVAVLRARYEKATGLPWVESPAAAVVEASAGKPPGFSGASDEKAPEKSGASDERKAPEISGASAPKAPEISGGIGEKAPGKVGGLPPTTSPTPTPTTNPPEVGAAEAAAPDEPTNAQAVALVDPYRDTLTVPDARELTRTIAAALRRGWTTSDVAAVLDRPLTGLDDPGRGLIGRVRKLGPPPAPHERPDPARRPRLAPAGPYRNEPDDAYLRWVEGPSREREPAA
ncbi:hypothetical protein [Micromonospora sp. WMMD737]|uniref:hypothetical protein n=1 Tax=Micromonospora sp. WMMD737 TaxID=3404113 RepID=UPI003B95C245